MSNSCLREGRKAACVCVFLSYSVIGGMEGREEMKEKERKGRDGVFNLLSTGEQGGKRRGSVSEAEYEKRDFRKGGEG